MTRAWRGVLGLAFALSLPRALGAQTVAEPSPVGPASDSVVVTPGAHYRAGGFHTLLFGRH